jgi:hypothetical protein
MAYFFTSARLSIFQAHARDYRSQQNSEMVTRLETQIEQQIEMEREIRWELTKAGIDVVGGARAAGGGRRHSRRHHGAVEPVLQGFLETRHRLEIPNLLAKYQEMLTIHKNILNEIASLRAYASKEEASRFMNTPALREWVGEEAEVKKRARSCSRPTQPKPSTPVASRPSPRDCMALAPSNGMNWFPSTIDESRRQEAIIQQRYPSFSDCMRGGEGRAANVW